MRPRAKKCDVCKRPIENRRNSLQVVCSPLCALEFNKRKKAKRQREQTKKDKETLLTHSEWINVLQKHINELVRLIDKGQNCISSDTPWVDGLMDAGHYYPRTQKYLPIRFHLMNIWAQGKHDNRFVEGNRQGMREGFIRHFGSFIANEIEDLPKQYPSCKWSINELRRAYKTCLALKKKARNLPILDPIARLQIRQMYNKEIGLY